MVATTRLPEDARRRYQSEADYVEWAARLDIYGVDLLNLGEIPALVTHVTASYGRLDILINNAAQTLQRDVEFFRRELLLESNPVMRLTMDERLRLKAEQTRICDAESDTPDCPLTRVMRDEHMQPVVQAAKNSWTSTIEDLSVDEIARVTVVNQIAPMLLAQQFKTLMAATAKKSADHAAWIVNVSSMEGKFARWKTSHHPHTNMAKAALNMFTHTSASEFAMDDIYMNSADTGWVTDENPFTHACYSSLNCPIDEVDAAARVLDTVMTASRKSGYFYKDYEVSQW